MTIDPKKLKTVLPVIADFFARSGRALPWRTDRDPYRVWLSEIMLQQTRVEAVIPYYARFLRADLHNHIYNTSSLFQEV